MLPCFSALEQELLLDDLLALLVKLELLEALRLREVADFLLLLCLLSFLPLVLRPLPMENAARWKRLERLQSSSQTIKRLWMWKA